jgi:hypothetical protein
MSGQECGRKCSLKRLAEQLSMQLPDDKGEALLVVEFMRELVNWEHAADAAEVLRLVVS